MNQKINRQGLENQKIVAQAKRSSHPPNQQTKAWEKRFQQQNQIIEKLLIKMSEYGIEISEQSLMEMQNQIDEDDNEEVRASTMDLIITFGPQLDQEAVTKQMMGARFESLNQLRETLVQEFNIVDDFHIKYVTEEGDLNELTGNTWPHMKQLSETNQIQLAVELTNGVVDEEPSNYEEDDFEEEDHNKILKEALTQEKVQVHFEELMIILKIKQVKKEDALRYILHGLRDEEKKKVKKITIAALHNQLASRIGFVEEVSEKVARYLIEKPNQDGKIEFSMQASIRRKDLHEKVLSHLKDYMLYNGLAITSLLNRLQGMFEDYKTELLEELESQDYDDLGTCPMADIYKSMKLVGLYPDSWDEDIREFVEFMAMRHSTSLHEIQYKDFIKIFDEDYNYLEDKKSMWENFGSDGEIAPQYQASSDEGELESEKSPVKDQTNKSPSNVEDLEQNELLEKVDEILMQIVQKLPPSQKIKTLTQYLMPYLSPIFDQSQQRQYLIISQNAFIQFLLGQNQNQLGLQLDESHIICLLHLLVQEEDTNEQDSNNKYILYDEFIELVKTYMKKELIMQQSRSLGINYDILSKESVEFLFQIRSSLMHDNNINENSADEEDAFRTSEKKKQKSVPAHIREIFHSIVQAKTISLAKTKKGTQVEVMDFWQMLDILFVRLGIHSPGSKSLEELKFLMCLDFKYLEMVMLIKFDKIMHDLDYISIDLLRQAQDKSLDKQRKKALDGLKKVREDQLSSLKRQPQIYGTSSQQIEYQGAGVIHSSKQEKKRKRPDDKKQGISKKMGGRQEVEQSAPISKKFDQDLSDQKQRSSGGKVDINIDVEPNHSDIQDEGIEDMYDNFDDDDKAKQMAIAAEIAAAENISEFDDDYLQDDIPIDEDDDDEDGIISDNYENFTKDIAPVKRNDRPMTSKTPLDENVISMEHSDDIMDSAPNMATHMMDEVQPNDSQAEMEDSDNYEDSDEDEDIDDNYPEEMQDSEEDMGYQELNQQENRPAEEYQFPIVDEDHQIEDSSPMKEMDTSQPLNESSPEHEPKTFSGTQQDFNFHQNDRDSSIQVLRTFDQEAEDMSPPPKELSSEKEAQDLPLDRPQSSVQIVEDQYIQDEDSAPESAAEEDYSMHEDVQDGDKSLSKSPAPIINKSPVLSDEYIEDDFGESDKSIEVKKSVEIQPQQVPLQPQQMDAQQHQQPQSQDNYSDDDDDYEF